MTTEIRLIKKTVYGILEETKQFIFSSLNDGSTNDALRILNSLIQLIPQGTKIPPGRPYASKSKELNLDMRSMAMKLLYGDGEKTILPDRKRTVATMLTVLNWLKQSENDVKNHLLNQLVSLHQDLIKIFTMADELEKKKAGILEKINVIQMAVHKVEREGSPPLLNERALPKQ